jgi:DNA polymerase-3 subunit alpha
MSKFYHLHVHSHYSLLDGLAKIDQLVQKAKEFDMPALALTDHGAMYGVIEFYQKCKQAGIKPIIGLETYLAPRTMFDKQPKVDTNPYHLVLLAKNKEGYQNLIQIASAAHLQGYYYKPRVDKELLRKYSKGLICLTACLHGDVPVAILSGNFKKAEEIIKEYQDIFGKENFYLELQDHPNIPEQKIANQKMIELSKKTNAPLVATNDVHYLNPSDQEAHEILLCIQTGKTYDDENRLSMKIDDFSFKPEDKMLKAFSNVPEAIENTQKIASQCNLEIELGKFVLPKYDVSKGTTEDEYLKKLCQGGLQKRYGNPVSKEVLERLEEELSVIKKAGFAPYFLIVQDFVNWAKKEGVFVGPGRGSAAGSLVSYLLGITDIDPLFYNLLFERFLSKEGERVAPPDIDLDFAEDRRDEVIDYITKKYGKDKVAQIVTFGTMASRAAVRDVARALGMSYSQGDEIAKLIPFGVSLDQALKVSPLLFERYKNETDIRRLIDLAKQLEGVARHASTHAAGLVIGKDALTNYVPLQKEVGKEENIVTQYSMYDLEVLGLLKIDILGLANLTIIQNTLKIISKTKGLQINLSQIPLDDPKVFQLLGKGETQSVFQLESEGMKKWLKELKPTRFEDIIAMIALYRPGPMNWIPDYIAAKHVRKKPTYLHPKLEPILKDTYGVPVFQEQVMQIARDLAGFSYAEADVLRKAIGKKIKKLLLAQKDKFIQGCINNGIDKSIAEKIFEFIEPFARYSFNAAHSTCYAKIAYWTAYLKSHFPSEYMAAFLTNEQTDLDKLALAIRECGRMKIKVLPPDVNESWPDFAVVPETGDIRFGLAAIKNVGKKAAFLIIEERKKKGPYKSLENFIQRLDSSVLNKKILESLAKAGALDRFGERTIFLAGIDQILKFVQRASKGKQNNQLDLFGGGTSSLHTSFIFSSLPNIPPASKNQKLAWEKELLGMYVSEHPLSDFNHIWEGGAVLATPNITFDLVGKRVSIAGIITKIQRVMTKNGAEMAFIKVEDFGGGIEVLVFPKVLKNSEDVIQKDNMVLIKGKVSEKDKILKILADQIQGIKPASKKIQGLFLTIPRGSDKELLKRLKEIILTHQGNVPIILKIPQNGGFKEIKVKSSVKVSETLLSKLTAILGTGKVEVR